jgi:hypothetical protein
MLRKPNTRSMQRGRAGTCDLMPLPRRSEMPKGFLHGDIGDSVPRAPLRDHQDGAGVGPGACEDVSTFRDSLIYSITSITLIVIGTDPTDTTVQKLNSRR